jgi:hypothetical protein
LDDLDYIERFEPIHDEHDWVIEDSYAYAQRMQSTLLPKWPTEVLIEWFHRHAGSLEKYAFLKYEHFSFRRDTWYLEHIPDRRAFDDGSFCDSFMNIECRAEDQHDWLANYMLRQGTWNTPIILLDNPDSQYKCPSGRFLKSPYHLLEGHRRLSFLNGLRQIGKALPQHEIWLVKLNR